MPSLNRVFLSMETYIIAFIAALAVMLLTNCTTTPTIPGLPGGIGGGTSGAPIGTKSCGNLPGTQYGKYCVWRTCPVAKGTLIYGHGLGEDSNSPDAAGSLIVPAHTEFQAMATKKCLDLLVFSWATPGAIMNNGWMVRPPGTSTNMPPSILGPTPQSPMWAEVNSSLDYLTTTLKLTRPYIGYGQSMGGFNLATIANLKPGYFDKLLLTHPVITNFPDFSSFKLATVLIGTNFTTQDWVIASPLNTIKKVQTMPPLYVMACPQDEYGLFIGPKNYAAAAKSRGFNSTFEQSRPGCHHVDSPSTTAQNFAQP